ncbi:MAG: hypothetical protein WD059_00580 [Balneolaceae bacterium]
MIKKQLLHPSIISMVILVFFFGNSCGLLGEEDEKPKDLIPLETGNYWDYHRWYISPNIADTIREEILSKHTFLIDGQQENVYGYQRFYLTEDKSEIEYQWLRMNDDEGSHIMGGISVADTLIQKNVYYKHPESVGQSWDFFAVSYNFDSNTFSIRDTITIEVISLNDSFETEFASYDNCYVYRYSEIGQGDGVFHWHHYVYIKPDIGIVGVETRDFLGSEDYENNPRVTGQYILIDRNLN